MSNKRLLINMIANLFSFVITIGINFILSPYIVNTVGSEAYGFLGLANNFVSYGQLITLALNSMASRFITIKIHQENIEEANRYFTSTIIANIVISIFLAIPSVFILINLNNLINIPHNILKDVQILWGLVFLNFIIGIILNTFNVATYVKNRLDLASVRDIVANIFKVCILLFLFSLFKPSIWYIGFATIISTIFIGLSNIYYKYKLIPDIKLNLKYFDYKVIYELLSSGIWHVIIKLGQILSEGLDLLISNIFLGASAMGVLSISKTLPTAIFSLLCTVTNVFAPQMTLKYAKNDKESLVKEIIKSMKFTGFFANIPLVFLIVFGTSFYSLWVPNEDIYLINFVAILTMLGTLVQGIVNPLFSLFTLTNKLRIHSFVILIIGGVNVILVLVLLNTSNLGVLAIAGVSSITNILRDLVYTPMYSAYCLEIKKTAFFPIIIKYLCAIFSMLFVFYCLSKYLVIDSWLLLIFSSLICGFLGMIVNFCILLDKEDRQFIINIIVKCLATILNKLKKVLPVLNSI